MSDSENGDEEYKLTASIGTLSVSAEGADPEWVSDQFDEKVDMMMDEAEKMSKAVRDGTRGYE